MNAARWMSLVLLVGCTGTEDVAQVIGGSVSASGSSANLSTGVAYAAELAGEILVTIFPRADATCESAGAEIAAGDPDWNPANVHEAGACGLIIQAPYEGSLSLSGATIVDATVTLNCAMDTGEWEYREGTSLYYDGYYYTGPWWQGSPETFDLDISGSEADGYSVSVAMEAYSGRFLYDLDDMENDPATGTISGTSTATHCDELIAGF